MNRSQRRDMMKKGVSEGTLNRVDMLNSPCTITEAVQIARGAAEDVMADYQSHLSTLQVAVSIQVEILKELVIKSGLISDEEFKNLYMQRAQDFQQMQKEYQEEPNHPTMSAKVGDVNIQKFEDKEDE